MTDRYKEGLSEAYQQALKSQGEGGIPIGSSLLDPQGQIIASGHNGRVQTGDPTAHAEIMCLRRAGRRQDWTDLSLVTTLSPCCMCSGAIAFFRIPMVIVGENKTFMGDEKRLRELGITIHVRQDNACIELMTHFIKHNHQLWHEDIGFPSP